MLTIDDFQYILSYTLTRNCYRDLDVVENSHAGKSIGCDDIFYQETYDACSKSIDEWIPRLINEFNFMVENKAENDHSVAFVLGCCAVEYKSWDLPIEVSDEFDGDIAGFLLDGTFRKACHEGWILGDESMNKINHDVYNRMYSLIKRGVINFDLI